MSALVGRFSVNHRHSMIFKRSVETMYHQISVMAQGNLDRLHYDNSPEDNVEDIVPTISQSEMLHLG